MAIGDFDVCVENEMCRRCQSPNLKLEVVECGSLDHSFKHYSLYCENRQQCEYAYTHGKESANLSCSVVKE